MEYLHKADGRIGLVDDDLTGDEIELLLADTGAQAYYWHDAHSNTWRVHKPAIDGHVHAPDDAVPQQIRLHHLLSQ
jgi:hypothetical protein